MTNKQIKEDICPYQGECSINGCKRNNDDCFIKQLFEERYMAEKQIVKLNKTIKPKSKKMKNCDNIIINVAKKMRKKFYECIIYTFIRGYINKNYNYYQPYILDCKRGFDEYNRCWLYKILKYFI